MTFSNSLFSQLVAYFFVFILLEERKRKFFVAGHLLMKLRIAL